LYHIECNDCEDIGEMEKEKYLNYFEKIATKEGNTNWIV
jgi:hypothetical protein